MTGARDALVIGAGPAGSAAAARLAARGFSVLLCDRASFPRDKLCGEFLSPECRGYFRELGVEEGILAREGCVIESVRFETDAAGRVERPLPGSGIGLSRRALDQTLAEEARRRGVEVRFGTRVSAVRTASRGSGAFPLFEADLVGGNGVEPVAARSVVDASGRSGGVRSPEDAFPRSSNESPGRRVAFQRHFRGPSEPVVEIYPFSGGYCGVAPVEDDRINVCFLGNTGDLRAAGGTAEAMLERAGEQNPSLAGRLASLEPAEERFRGASGFRFRRVRPSAPDRLIAGDAAAFIAPLCGDGIAMALRGALLAADVLESFLERRTTWDECRRAHRIRWRREFESRIRLGRILQEILTCPPGCAGLLHAARLWPGLADRLIQGTRGRGYRASGSPAFPSSSSAARDRSTR